MIIHTKWDRRRRFRRVKVLRSSTGQVEHYTDVDDGGDEVE